jgi:hypothetical protein
MTAEEKRREALRLEQEAEPVPGDAVVLRDLAHVLERGGEPYGWVPNRLRTIADRLEALPNPNDDSDWP